MRLLAGLLWIAVIMTSVGCQPPAQQVYAGLQAEDPAERIDAIVAAGQRKDQRAVPLLVERLSDPERDVRFYAILALERISGHTFGYEHYAPPAEQSESIQRWREYVRQRAGGQAVQTQADSEAER